MQILRVLALALLILSFVAPVAGQTSPQPNKIPDASQPQLDGLIATPEFRKRVLPLTPGVRNRVRDINPQLSFDPAPLANDVDCYTLRSYRVTRDDPQSDVVRPAGYSECQPAARF